jgi:YVTN family beta-propeller protein
MESKKTHMKKITQCLLLILLFSACEKEKEATAPTPNKIESGGVFISCEGNFQSGNSSVYYYNPKQGIVSADVYQNANHQPLGDICQSMNLINGNIYLVINNSGKIIVCDSTSLLQTSTISNLMSPRYIVQCAPTKAYVSDTYSNTISVVNLSNNQVTTTIPVNGWTEQMLYLNQKVYITDFNSEYLYVADPATDLISDSILISKGGSSILEDFNHNIWVLCGGDYLHTFNAALYKIDPSNNQVVSNMQFTGNDFPSRLCSNKNGDTLYYINSNIYRMSINDLQLPATAFINSTGNSFYGMRVDPLRDEIYVADAVDYIQKGKVYRYTSNGNLINTITTGIIPGDFLFLP